MPRSTIDDHEYEAEEGLTVLQVARTHCIQIPTLCYHPSLRPSGSCRLCYVLSDVCQAFFRPHKVI
jgi:NADH dehydrogenase/NADH:ubiquinone oxidoreductase subunit G